MALALARAGKTLTLAPGSLLGTGGGMKEAYDFGPQEIRRDLESVFRLADGGTVPQRDVYGMAEANWVAMQCSAGNYHVPPWVHAVTLDDDGGFQAGSRTTGLLAFFDPWGGGDLFPAFFRTADRVTMVAGRGDTDLHVWGRRSLPRPGFHPTCRPAGGGRVRRPGVIEGFWLPQAVRAQVISTETRWETLSFAGGRECGRECDADAPGAVAARWPRLGAEAWTRTLDLLSAARPEAPRGPEFWDRLQTAMLSAARRLSDPGDPLHGAALDALPRYTGYSPEMIASTLGAPDMWDLGQMAHALALSPTKSAAARWESLPGLTGRLRFFPGGAGR